MVRIYRQFVLKHLLLFCLQATVFVVQLDGKVGENEDSPLAACERQCVHGVCDSEGICMCDGCWMGQYCQDYANEHPPKFLKPFDEVEVNLAKDSAIIYKAEATDEDSTVCGAGVDCPCSKIIYEITNSNGGLFVVDVSNGAVSLTGTALMYKEAEYRIGIRVTNDDGFGFNEMTLMVIIISPFEDNWRPRYAENDGKIPEIDNSGLNYRNQMKQELNDIDAKNAYKNSFQDDSSYSSANIAHSRARRAVPTELTGNDGPATAETFYLYRSDAGSDKTEAYPGQKVCLTMAVHFTSTPIDMYVELFTPNNATTLMVLSDVDIDVGANVQGVASGITNQIKYQAKDSATRANRDDHEFDIASVTLGTAISANGAAGASVLNNVVKINFCGIMLDRGVNNDVEYLSAGAEYNTQQNVWVGMAPYTVKTDDLPDPNTNTYTVTGDDSVNYGSPIIFKIEAEVRDDVTDLTFDAFSPLDSNKDRVSVCGVALLTTAGNLGSNFAYSTNPFTKGTLTASTTEATSNFHGQIANLKVFNSDARNEEVADGTDDKLTFEVTYLIDDDVALVGQEYSVGVALSVGTAEIWAALINVTIAANVADKGSEPTYALSTRNNTNVKTLETKVIEVELDFGSSSTVDNARYIMELISPQASSKPLFKVCSAFLVSKGMNIPCFGQNKPVLTPANEPTKTTLNWDMGYIMNSRTFDPANNYYTSDEKNSMNKVKVGLVVQALDISSAWPATADLDIGLTRYGSTSSVGTVTLTHDSSPIDTSGQVVPTFELTMPDNNHGADPQKLRIGESREIRFKMTTHQNNFYNPMNFEIIMPFENELPRLSVRRVEVTRIGENLPCLIKEVVEQDIVYSSRVTGYEHEPKDKAVFSIGPLTNVQINPTGSPTEDEFEISFIIRVEDHPDNTQGSTAWVSAGVFYGSSTLWVGQLQVEIDNVHAVDTITPADWHMDVERIKVTGTDTGEDLSTTFQVILKVPRYLDADIVIKAESQTSAPDFSICNMRAMEAGRNLPSFNKTLEPEFTKFTTGNTQTNTRNKAAQLNLGVVSNIADSTLQANNTVDDDTIIVYVVARAHTGATGSHDIKFTATANNNNLISSGADITKTLTNVVAPNTLTHGLQNDPPSVTFEVGKFSEDGDTSNNIKIGETKVLNLNIEYKDDTAYSTVVTFTTPIVSNGGNLIEILSASVVSVGDNLPCLDKKLISATLTDRVPPIKGEAVLDLGRVCQVPFRTNQSEIVVEVVVRAVPKETTTQTVRINAAVDFTPLANVNGGTVESRAEYLDLNIQTGMVPIVNQNATGATIAFTSTTSPIPFEPREEQTLELKVVIPVNTTRQVTLDVETPKAATAVMIVTEIAITGAGDNIGGAALNAKPEYSTLTRSSQLSNSQTTYGVLDLGSVTNDGHMYRKNDYTDGDFTHDTLTFEIKLVMADAEASIANAEFNVSAGARLSNEILIINKLIQSNRGSGPYEPEYDFILALDSPQTFANGATFTVNGRLEHKTTSKGEGRDVHASVYIPESLSFASMGSYNSSLYALTVNSSSNNMVIFQVPYLAFTDNVTFAFDMRVDSVVASSIAIPYEAALQSFHNSLAYTFSPIAFIGLNLVFVPSAGCTPVTLGMDVSSKKIADCQISVYPPSNQPPSSELYVRPGQPTGWISGSRYGIKKYVQVDFGNQTQVTSIILTTTDPAKKPQVVSIAYSDDVLSWVDEETFTPSWSGNSLTLTVVNPRASRAVRLYVDRTDTEEAVNVQVEFEGCQTPGTISLLQVCQSKPSNKAHTKRSFLVNNNVVYFCDQLGEDSTTKCTSTEGTTRFEMLPPDIGKVIGMDTSTNTIYAKSWDARSILATDGEGMWRAITESMFIDASNKPTFISANNVEWIKDVNVQYQGWTGTSEGLFKNGQKIVDWRKCCLP